MSDPQRLLESEADDFERELLTSALPDRGSERALHRTLVSIGAGTALGLASTATANAASAALAAPASGALMVMKWLGIGAALGLVTAGGVDFAMHRGGAESATHAAAPPAEVAPALAENAALAEQPAATSNAEPELAPKARARARAPESEPMAAAETPAAPSVGALPAAAQSSELLLREVRALDRAKSSLSRGDAAGALSALDDHARSFPKAALGPEADVLRVRALIASGNRSAALAIGRRLVARQPTSAHARAVIALLPELGTNP